MDGKTILNLIHKCCYGAQTHVRKYIHSIFCVPNPFPGLDSNCFSLQLDEVHVNVNRAAICFGPCCESLWKSCLLALFVWPVGSHLVWMMAAVRVPLASVTPDYGCLVSCSVQRQLLGLCSTPVSTADCGWGEHVSGGKDAERSEGESNPGCTHGSQSITENIILVILATWIVTALVQLWWVWPSLGDRHTYVCVGSVVRVILWSRQLWLLVQQVIAVVEFAGWTEAAMNTTTRSVADYSWDEQDPVGHGSHYSVSSTNGVWGWWTPAPVWACTAEHICVCKGRKHHAI